MSAAGNVKNAAVTGSETEGPGRVLISVAPVSAADTHIDPAAIAADVLACAKAGAAMVHLHVRNEKGQLTPDLTVFKETAERIREQSDIIIEASTGGVSDLTIEERCQPLYYDKVEACSLNVGSTNLGNAVYRNPIPEVKYCVQQILAQHKTPEVEVFELGHIAMMQQLQQEFGVPEPLLYTIVLGHPGEAPATPEALMAMRQFLPAGAVWGITHAYRRDFGIIAAALGLGACTVRIGFEDSAYLTPDQPASANAPLVGKTAALIRAMDKEIMTPAQARACFQIGTGI